MPRNTTTDDAARGIGLNPMGFGIDRATEAGQKSLISMAHLHTRLMRNALEVNAELLDFARRRVGEDITTNEKLSRCRNVADAVEVMSGFYQRALEDYAEEADKIVKLGADATRRSVEETQAEADEVMLAASEKVALPE